MVNTDGKDDLLTVEAATGRLWLYPGPKIGRASWRERVWSIV